MSITTFLLVSIISFLIWFRGAFINYVKKLPADPEIVQNKTTELYNRGYYLCVNTTTELSQMLNRFGIENKVYSCDVMWGKTRVGHAFNRYVDGQEIWFVDPSTPNPPVRNPEELTYPCLTEPRLYP